MKRISTTILFICLTAAMLAGQPNQNILDYIDRYKAIAVQEMIDYRIPASITMAQGIIESGAGLSELAKESNNHFGIKCHTDWKGEKVYHDDDEKGECFRKYDAVEDSYRDHSLFLSGKPRYAGLFELEPDDYKGWAKGLKAAGYATNPKYADMLINMIEEYALHELDKMTMADVKKAEKKKDDEKKAEDPSPVVQKSDRTDEKEKRTFNWGGYDADVYYFNRIPTITAKAGDTPESVAKEHHLKISQVKEYNDLGKGQSFEPGTKIYLQPKRKRGDTKYHIVRSGETMWTISRDAGVLLSHLYKYNNMQPGQEPAEGEQINLRSKRRDPVKLQTPATKTKTKPAPAPAVKQATEQEEKKADNNDIYIDFDEELVVPEQKTGLPDEQLKEQPAEIQNTVTPLPSDDVILTEQYHIVAAKETLYGISKKYNVTVEQIQKWNALPDTNIKTGQQLIVGYK